jgi:hypothetical protein
VWGRRLTRFVSLRSHAVKVKSAHPGSTVVVVVVVVVGEVVVVVVVVVLVVGAGVVVVVVVVEGAEVVGTGGQGQESKSGEGGPLTHPSHLWWRRGAGTLH